jgi:hypothetical protein
MYDGLQEVPSLTAPPPPAPPSMYDGLVEVTPGAPRAASGLVESLQAGFQGSAPGLAWRGKLPDLVMDPQHAAWWERAATGIAQVASELPLMGVGGAAGGAAGAAVGTVIAPGPGTAVGTILGSGAGMFAVPAAIRESLIQAYKSGEVKTAADWFNILREVATTTVKEAGIGAVTFGAGSVAARTVGKALVPAIGESMTVGTGTKIIGATDTAAQIAAMVSMPAAFQGRLPDWQEFMDAAIVIGGLKAAHPIAARITNVFRKTGKTPAEQVQDAMADPKVADELRNGPAADVDVPPLRGQLSKQEELWTIQSRLDALTERIAGRPEQKTVDDYGNEVTLPAKQPELFTYAEKQEYDALKAKAATLEAEGIQPEVPRGTGPRFADEQLVEAKDIAARRIAELTTKEGTGPLTDVERAERIGLVNSLANPEALAKRFGIEPAIRVPTAEESDTSAKTVYDDLYGKLIQADKDRVAVGREPLGEKHAADAAYLISRESLSFGKMLGRLPFDVYKERYLGIREEPRKATVEPDVAEQVAATPPDLPFFVPPEVDLFGNPIAPETAPRVGVADLATQEVPLAGLKLSKEVPQFKKDANAEGVIVPLGGKFDRTGVGPIQVWERLDGTMEVISGRHRLDLARRSGEETIPAQIHREADGFTAKQAATLDAQLNIREEQGSGADFAQYFRDSGISEQTANELGLLARAKGRGGFAIARDASPDTLAAHRAGLLSDDAALAISQTAPGSERLQALGIAMVNDGKSTLYATNMMRSIDLMASERMAAGAQGDIFGFDDSAMREAAAMAKKASSKQRAISEQISAVSGASRRPELARKMGVDVQDPEGIQKRIAELKQEQYQWDNWPLYPELVAKLRGADTLKQEPISTPIDSAVDLEQKIDENGGTIYVRWSAGPEHDMKPGAVSRDYLAGSEHGGLSASPLTSAMDADRLAGFVWEYMFLRMKGDVKPHFYAAERIGTDSDGYALIRPTKYLGTMSDQLFRAFDATPLIRTWPDRKLFQDDFDLKPETPAELKARDEEATAAAKRKLAQERAGVKGPVPTVDQADLFNTQRSLFQTALPVDSEPFKRWFGDSKVVDAEGKPLVVYHGTDSALVEFGTAGTGRNGIEFGPGIYVTDNSVYAEKFGSSIMPLYVKAENIAEAEIIPHNLLGAQAKEWALANGYDAIRSYKGDFGGKPTAQIVVFHPTQIKSAIGNTGAFDPKNPNILYQSKEDKPWYYSELARQISALPAARVPTEGLTGAEWSKLIWEPETTKKVALRDAKNKPTGETKEVVVQGKSNLPGVKQEEIEATGINDWLATQEGKVTKEQVQAFMEQGGVKVTETVLGETSNQYEAFVVKMQAKYGEGYETDVLTQSEAAEQARLWTMTQQRGGMTEGQPKFDDPNYQLPNSVPGSYRELVLTLPEKPPTPRAPDTATLPDGYRVEQMANGRFTLVDPTGTGSVLHDSHTTMATATAEAIDYLRAINKMPAREPAPRQERAPIFESSHFPGSDYLAHTRVNDRVLPDGRKVLFVEEIQSDRAQKGRTEGFQRQLSSVEMKELGGLKEKLRNKVAWTPAEQERAVLLENLMTGHGIPAAPFVTKTDSWTALVLKRLLRYAAEGEYDAIAWTRGEQQVERYTNALRKAVDVIEWKKTPEGVQIVGYKGETREYGDHYDVPGDIRDDMTGALQRAELLGFDHVGQAREAVWSERRDWRAAFDWTGTSQEDMASIQLYIDARNATTRSRIKVVDTTEKESALSDAIGKSMADRIRNDPNQTGTIEGENINVRTEKGKGMYFYYDEIVPKVTEKVAKHVGGGKVVEIELGQDDAYQSKSTPVSRLEFREAEQNRLDSIRDAFPEDEYFPIVAINKDGALVILDGHNRAAVAQERGHDIPVVQIPQEHYSELSKKGFDDIEISWAALREAGEQEAADALNSQFPGANVEGRGLDAWQQIPEQANTKQEALSITPAMREKIMAGQALFQKPGQERDGQHLGSYSVAERLITLFESANKSTVIHEVGHHFLENLKHFASQPDAPARIRDMWQTARQEFAIGEDGEISTASHEMNARSFERYLGEGVAPSTGLRAVFAQFKAWMLEIYGNLQNLGVNINPEVRALFDKMLATDQEIADARALNVPRAYVPEARAAAAERIVPPAPEGRKIEPGFEAEKASMEPYADALPSGPGEAPDSSHINYAYINSPMDVKLAMQRMAEIDQANIQKQRGGTAGVKSWEQANAEQAKYVNDILGGSEDTLRLLSPRDPNAAGPDVKLGILKKLAVGAAQDSARLRDVVLTAGHDATVRQQLEYMGSIERARMIQAEFLGERAGVARALNALKDVTEGTGEIGKMLDAIGYGEAAARELYQTARTPAEEQAYMRAKLDEILQNYKGKSVLDIAKLHKEIGTLKGTFKFSKEVTKATKWEMVVEGWKASILSGPVTHTTNLFGTEGFHFLRPAVDALAATIGMARGASPGMGESDRASMSEAVARIGGMISGIQDGVKVAVATFKLDDPTGKTEAYRTAIPGRAGELIRIPLRLMGAEDAMVTTMYKRGELATLAIRRAFDEQMNPSTREFAERVTYLKEHPTPEMEAAAEAAATRMTFNAPLGEKGVALQLFVQKWNLQWMIPFIRTPINITKEVARMSPLAPMVGEWRAAIAKGGVERDRAIAETVLGAGIMALTMAMTFEGTVSGSGDADPGKNRGKVGVWQPYSRLIGDTWYEYARIQPIGTLVGMAADVATIWDHMNDEEKDKIPKLLAVAFSNAVTNQTFLQGITNVINAMSEPTRFLPRFANQMAGSMVPNIIAQPTAMADPAVREVNGMIEAIQARIPGMRQMLMPKRDWLGEEVQSKERVGVIMPSRKQPVSEDKVRLEAARLNISMAAAPKKTHIGKGTGKMGDVPLTPEQRNTFAKVGGEMAHQVLTNVVNAPGYDDMPDLVKRKIFAKVLQASHQIAAVAALPPEKRVAYITSITEKMATALEPETQ